MFFFFNILDIYRVKNWISMDMDILMELIWICLMNLMDIYGYV